MRNPFSWFRKKDNTAAIVDKLTELVQNLGYGGSTYNWQDIFGNLHPRDLNNNAQLNLSAVFCALQMYSGAVLTCPRLVQRIDGATGLPTAYVSSTEHPAARIWKHYVSEEMNSDEFMKNVVYDVLTDGNCYGVRQYDNMGRTSGVEYVHASRVPRGNITRAKGSEIVSVAGGTRKASIGEIIYRIDTGYNVQDQYKVFISRKDMAHIKGPIPDSENFRSFGIGENNHRSNNLYESSEKLQEYFYRRGATNQMFLSTEHLLAPQLKKELEELFNGSDGLPIEDIFKTRILQQGLKPMHVGMPPQVMMLLETKALAIEDVARWFNMPTALLFNLIGVSGTPEDYQNQMLMWIQNGLGQFMSNIENQFRYEFLPRSSQTSYAFIFDRLHLYKTVINELSQALRNLFEIGAIDTRSIASLIGTHIDPRSASSTQRYVPANIITVAHSKSLEKKAKTSLEVMQEQIKKLQLDLKQSKDNHKKAMEAPTPQDPAAPPQDPQEPPSDVPNPAEGKPQEDANSDKKTRTAKMDNLIRTSFWNVLKGLHDHEVRVVQQKKKSRGDDFENAMQEWRPKLENLLQETLTPWEEVLDEFKDEMHLRDDSTLTDAVQTWLSNSFGAYTGGDVVQNLESRFEESYSFLKDENGDQTIKTSGS